jgi:hypothetical protein
MDSRRYRRAPMPIQPVRERGSRVVILTIARNFGAV